MPLRWIAFGAVAYLACILALFPAGVAWRWFAPDAVRLAGVQGTVWSGRAALGSAGTVGLRDIRWQVRLAPMFRARLGGRLQADLGDGFLRTDIRLDAGGVTLTGLSATGRLSSLAGTLPIAGIRGRISATLTELVIRDGWPVAAQGQVRLGQLTVPSLVDSETIALGDYLVTLSGTGGLRGAFEDQGGPLEVSGSAELTASGDYRIGGAVRVRSGAGAALERGVELLTTEPDAAGMRAFGFSGTL